MIETARLRLEALSRAHLEPWLRFMMDGDARAGLHTPDPAESEAQATAGLDRFVEVATMYALVVRETEEVAGFAGFVPRTMDWGEELELGWMLLPDQRGRGYATEAAQALRARKAGRVISLIREDNPASQRVAQRLGAERERIFTYWGYATGLWVTHTAWRCGSDGGTGVVDACRSVRSGHGFQPGRVSQPARRLCQRARRRPPRGRLRRLPERRAPGGRDRAPAARMDGRAPGRRRRRAGPVTRARGRS